MEKWNTPKKPRIGIYTMGLKAYWNQFRDCGNGFCIMGSSLLKNS
ncbi:MAG: hypothetical protein ACLVAW_03040 [Eisenbergiella massiliensis]